MTRFMIALGLCSVFACGKKATTGDDMGPTADAPALSGDKYSLTWGPIDVPSGVENTQCIWVKLSNTAAIKVHQMHNVLSTSSHHLIVYKDDMDTTEQLTPVNCQPFTGALNTTGMITPLVITQKKDDEITLPDGVAYTFDANQMVKLEFHYINSSDSDDPAVGATVDFYSADPATIQYEASILFTGSPDIGMDPQTGILPGQQFELHQFFTLPSYVDLSQSNIFAITGHEHHYGTNVQVNVAPATTGPMTPVYAPNPFLWSEPVTATFATPFSVPVGGGFDFTCDWTNTGTTNVKFGESANDEMCFFWAYYYPSQGSKVCIHTNAYGGANGLNACCPGDPTICQLINQQF